MKKYILFGLILCCLSSCEFLAMDDSPPNTPTSNFESLWKTLNERYSFFEYKNIDWNAVYNQYRPKVDDNISNDSLFQVCKSMIQLLEDGHTYLIAENNVAWYPDFFLDRPANFNEDVLKRSYWRDNDIRITGSLRNCIIRDVGYIYYQSFQNPVLDNDLDYVLESFKDTKGLIIDIRHNGGGDPENGFRILERIAQTKTHVFNSTYKSGAGKNDFSGIDQVYLTPRGTIRYDKPVIVLTNRLTYSAANLFATMAKVLPNVQLMGDTSGGGGGVPAVYEMPNGWRVGFSSSILSMPNGFIIENGIDPDTKIDLDELQAINGIDTILEEALNQLQ